MILQRPDPDYLHELANQLALIRNYVQIIRDDLPGNTEVIDDLGEIERAAERASIICSALVAPVDDR